jgi:hypothetical protein
MIASSEAQLPSEAQPPLERSGAGSASVELEGKLVSAGSDVICADEFGSW